jgi:hypothetical protein
MSKFNELYESVLAEAKMKKQLKRSDKKLGKLAQKTKDLTKLSDHEFFRAYDYWHYEDFENYDPTPEHIEILKRVTEEFARRSNKKLDFSKYSDKDILELYEWYSGNSTTSTSYGDAFKVMLEPLHNEIIDRGLMQQYIEDYVGVRYNHEWHNDRDRF